MTDLNLPEPINRYFNADKQRGTEALADCFTSDAVVIDEQQTYTGVEAIVAWKLAASSKFEYTVNPTRVERSSGNYLVKAIVRGNFPGSPVELQYAFELKRGKIASLEITP